MMVESESSESARDSVKSPVTKSIHVRAFEAITEGRWWAYFLLLPSLLMVGAVIVYPVVDGVLLSFREYRLNRPALGTPWIGLEHYRTLTSDPIIRTALSNTLIWVAVGSISQFVLGMIAALALQRPLMGMRVARVLVLIPWLLPSVVSANMWRFMLDSRLGVVNDLLIRANIMDSPRAWFTSPDWALYEALIVELWKNFPFFTLFLMAGLYAIPQELYDASSVDGGGVWERFRSITIPLLMPVIVASIILRVIGLFNSPDMLLILTGGGPGNATQTISLYGFQTAYLKFDFGYAAAISVMALGCLLAFTVVYVRVSGVTKE
ncbi:MAG TPA: sugar ABC transporter permease [Thermomicrobiales bacterium]|nr:sugar ABC transporter permease [Thermomicrobiales bacterium]